MKTSRSITALVSTLSLIGFGACSSSTPKDADNAQATSSPPATSAPATATAQATSAPIATATAVASSGPVTPPAGPEEVAKDPNPLVVELKVEATSGTLSPADVDRIKATFVGLAAASPKVAMTTSKGAPTKRRVLVRLLVDPVVEVKDKLSVKVAISAVTLDGSCPLFDLKQKAELSRAVNNATDAQKAQLQRDAKIEDDPAAVRNAAVQLIFAQLEAEQSKLKPDAQCLPNKPAH